MARVSLEAVAKNFGRVTALRDVTFSAEPGEVVSILGPSGCGKTTLLRIIAGLELPSQGAVRIGDKIMTDGRFYVHPRSRGVGMVFQDLGLWPHVNVEKTLMLSAGADDMSAGAVDYLLDSIGLGDKRKRYPHELSGGEQQRLALARALAGAPEVLLLDEPLANLDAPLREEVLSVLSGIHRKRPEMTIIAASHQQQEAIEFSDRLVIMADGVVEQCAPPEEVFSRPASRFVASFFRLGLVAPAKPNSGKVATPLGNFQTDAPAHGPGWVLVRPEQLEQVEADGCENPSQPVIEGIVEEKIFRGYTAIKGTLLYRIRFGDIIAVLELGKEHAPGGKVYFRVREPVRFLEK